VKFQVAAAGHGRQFPAMLPGVRPGSVIGHVTNGIAADGIAVVSRQQVTPVGVTVGVGLGALRGSQGSGGVGVFFFA